jgi:DNA-binding HxlR family transcriptional regulator
VPLGREYATQNCALARSLEVVGERWTMLILRDLFFGVRRFGALQSHLDIPRAVLSTRLASLIEHGVVERRPYGRGRDEFVLTDAGLELWPVVYRLMQWGEEHLVEDEAPVRRFLHAICGTDLSPAGSCSTCDVEPEPAEIETRPGTAPMRVIRTDAVSAALRQPHRLLTPL